MSPEQSVLLRIRHALIAVAVAGLSGLLAAFPVQADPWQVQIDTTGLNGTSVQLAFDFIDGGTPANQVVVSGFGGGSGLSESSIGDVAGSLASSVAFGDSQFFNEHLAMLTLGSNLQFQFNPSANAPSGGSFPDSFSFFMLDSVSGLPLFATGDSSGALFRFDITGPASSVAVFSVPGGEVSLSVSVVPEPPQALLLAAGLALLARRLCGRRRR